MQNIPEQCRDWLPELAHALEAIAGALGGEEPTPARLVALAPEFANAVGQHQVDVHWYPRGYLNDHDIDEPGEPKYVISISGNRLNAAWLIPTAELAGVLALSIDTRAVRR